MATTPRRLLLITPSFHTYWASIRDALQRRGHHVDVIRYDAYDTVLEKTRLKATVELPARLHLPGDPLGRERTRTTDRVIERFQELHPDGVIVIKGDLLDARFWDALGQTPRILWLYDDLHRHDYDLPFLRQIGPVISYARSEADTLRSAGVNATVIPNAFDPHRVTRSARRSGEVAFVGAGYPERYAILTRLAEAGLPVHAYGRDFSRHLFDRARTFSWHRPPITTSRGVPLERAYEVVGAAAAAVNIHGQQAGHAMRTFEIPGMGGVQLVDRADVAQFYDVGEEVAV
ncbi:MAG: hypothetical protein Q4G40_09535, partial [Brachybacterium sp.]|nr:hypothetical protein [Brachybacterium sp.]